MLKVTIKFSLCSIILFAGCGLLLPGCNSNTNDKPRAEDRQREDSISEARIDSAYAAINNACDTALLNSLPVLADSLMKGDTAYLQTFFDSITLYNDADKKVEKVVRQLKADCDSNLRKETYKRVQLLQKAKRSRHKK